MPHSRPYIPYYMHKFNRKKALGGTIGSVVGGIGGAFLGNPMAGMAIGKAAGSGIESLVKSGQEEEKEIPKEPIEYASSSLGNYRDGGKMRNKKGYKEFAGPSHEQGGIQLPNGTEVEGGETMDNINLQGGKVMKNGEPYVFSKTLKVPGSNMSFAKYHKQLKKRDAGEKAIRKLAMMQEKAAGRVNKQMPSGQGNKGESMMGKGGKMKKYKGGGTVSMKQGAGAVPYGFRNSYQWYRGGGVVHKKAQKLMDKEGYDKDQAYAIAYNMQDNNELRGGGSMKKKYQTGGFNDPEDENYFWNDFMNNNQQNTGFTSQNLYRPAWQQNTFVEPQAPNDEVISPNINLPSQRQNNAPMTMEIGSNEEVDLDQDIETASVPEGTEGMSAGEIATAPKGTFEGESTGGGEGTNWGTMALQFAPDLINLATGIFGKDDAPKATQVRDVDIPDYDTTYNINPLLRRSSAGYRAILNNPNMNANQKIAAYSQKLKSDSMAFARKENKENQMRAQKARAQANLESQQASQQAQFDAQARQDQMVADAQSGITGNFARQSLSSIASKILQMKKEKSLSERDKQIINAMIEGYGGNKTHKNYLRNLMMRGQ